MKKTLLFSLLLVFSSLFSFAQEVKTKVLNNGSTYLSFEKFYILNYSVLNRFALSCYITPDDDYSYRLTLALEKKKMQIDKGQKLLINFEDGSILELTNSDKVESKKYAEGQFCIPVYTDITESEMEQLVSKKITKLSFECKSGIFDIDILDNKFSNALKQRYDKLNEALTKYLTGILSDKTENGIRTVLCDTKTLNYPNIFGVSLGCHVLSDGNHIYDLYLTKQAIDMISLKFSEGQKLLIKLDDGSILEYPIFVSKKALSAVIGYGDIPESEMEQLVSKKITKIRVEHDSGYIDQDTSDDKLSNALKKLYGQIQEALNAPKKDIYSDF